MQKITPFLWFEKNAQEAVDFYVEVFKNSKILFTNHYDEAGSKASGQAVGSVMIIDYELDGQKFTAINGGTPPTSGFQAFDRVSFVVGCANQEEVDYFWGKLSEGGEAGVCGWINHDKFGVTWQITPKILLKYLSDPDSSKVQKVMEAMLKMKKIIIKDLEEAYEN